MELMSLIKTMLMPRVTPRILFSGFGFFLCCTRPAIWIRSGGSTQRILSPFCNLGHGEQNNLFLFIHEDQTTHLAYPILSTQLTRSYKYMEYHGIHWILEYTAEYTTCFLCLLSLGVPFSWVARCLPLDAHGSCQTSCSSFVPGSQLYHVFCVAKRKWQKKRSHKEWKGIIYADCLNIQSWKNIPQYSNNIPHRSSENIRTQQIQS